MLLNFFSHKVVFSKIFKPISFVGRRVAPTSMTAQPTAMAMAMMSTMAMVPTATAVMATALTVAASTVAAPTAKGARRTTAVPEGIDSTRHVVVFL